MKNIHLTILGCCRNNGKWLPGLITNIEQIVKHFKSYTIHIAHNDSSDNTEELLNIWMKNDINCNVYHLNGLVHTYRSRTQRLAYCRNLLLEKAIQFTEDHWILILDMDDVNSEIFKGFENVFRLDSNRWAALFINQIDQYYDIWALRIKQMNWDCWQMIRTAIKKGISMADAKELFIKKYQTPISPDSKVIPVLSAFGGAGLYQSKYLKNCKYVGLDELGHEICEHVSFHKGIVDNGGKMFILPCWQNKTATEHIVSP